MFLYYLKEFIYTIFSLLKNISIKKRLNKK